MKKTTSWPNIPMPDGTSTLRLIVALLSATTLHTFGVALSASPSAILFVDHVTYASTSLQFIGAALFAVAASRLINELVGSEFPYKSMRRDRENKRAVLKKSDYLLQNDNQCVLMTAFGSFLIFLIIYFRSSTAIFYFFSPILAYIFFFTLHWFWATTNSFKRENQETPAKRLWRIFRRSKVLAGHAILGIARNWIRPRIFGLLTLMVLSSGIARGFSQMEEVTEIGIQGERLLVSIIFRNSSGFVAVEPSSRQSWFVSYDGVTATILNDRGLSDR